MFRCLCFIVGKEWYVSADEDAVEVCIGTSACTSFNAATRLSSA